jgi:hypothetical protein
LTKRKSLCVADSVLAYHSVTDVGLQERRERESLGECAIDGRRKGVEEGVTYGVAVSTWTLMLAVVLDLMIS